MKQKKLSAIRTILFLDFDGVLHPFPAPIDAEQWFSNLPRLETLLREFPDVLIVISSSWREDHSLPELIALFSEDIGSRIIGALPVLEVHSLVDTTAIRFKEIELFLAGHEAWLYGGRRATRRKPQCHRRALGGLDDVRR